MLVIMNSVPIMQLLLQQAIMMMAKLYCYLLHHRSLTVVLVATDMAAHCGNMGPALCDLESASHANC